MKKLVLIVMAVALVLTTSVAFAATPFDAETTLKIDMVQDFSDTSSITGAYLGVPDGATDITSDAFTGSYEIDGKLSVLSTAAVWTGILDTAFAGVNTNAEGFGFYVKNLEDVDVTFNFYLVTSENGSLNAGAYTIGSEKDYYLVDANSMQTVTAPANVHPTLGKVQSAFTVPANFEGYVCVPFENLQMNWTETMFDNSTVTITGFGAMNGGDTSVFALDFDNIFVYGENVTEDRADQVLSILGGEQPEDTESTEPENTESTEPSDQPSDDNNDDEQESTADISVIAYAVAAITGLGALVVAKRK